MAPNSAPPRQEFLVVNAAGQGEPKWMHNFSTQAQDWLSIQTRVILPCALPESLPHAGFALEVQGRCDLVPAAVYSGTFLTVNHLRSLLRALNVDIPKEGSGRRRECPQSVCSSPAASSVGYPPKLMNTVPAS